MFDFKIGPIWQRLFFLMLMILIFAVPFNLSYAKSPPDEPTNARVLVLDVNDEAYEGGEYELDEYLYVLADAEGEWGIDEVSSAAFAHKFVPNETHIKPIDPEVSAYWVRLTIQNSLPYDEEWLAGMTLRENFALYEPTAKPIS